MEPSFVDFIAVNGDDVSVNVPNVLFVGKGPRDAKGDHAEIVFGPGQSRYNISAQSSPRTVIL